MTSYRYCPDCRDERVFEQPPCEDGHDDCPDWICVDCGSGIVVAWFAADRPASVPRDSVLPESVLLEPAMAGSGGPEAALPDAALSGSVGHRRRRVSAA